MIICVVSWSFNGAPQVVLVVKNLPVIARDVRVMGLIPGLGRRAQQPTLVFLPEESHGQRSLEATVHGVAKSWI